MLDHTATRFHWRSATRSLKPSLAIDQGVYKVPGATGPYFRSALVVTRSRCPRTTSAGRFWVGTSFQIRVRAFSQSATASLVVPPSALSTNSLAAQGVYKP